MDNWAYPRSAEGREGPAKDDANSIHKRSLPLITQAVALSGE